MGAEPSIALLPSSGTQFLMTLSLFLSPNPDSKLTCTRSLHQPMYLLYLNLSANDVLATPLSSRGSWWTCCALPRSDTFICTARCSALQTCSTHLFSYLLFLGCGMLIVISHRFPHLVQERKFITIMFHLLPSSLNRSSTESSLRRSQELQCAGINIVIFGGIDGYSRKIMFLGAANNNRSDTALSFFEQAVEEFGYPLK
ncbi:hypothetical protein WMY93_028377 [Mugilogobius chulae]|uniref:Integrase core domain-containing protein n=1 Tax=Mugilogobius chulae TaxID=88201 RepID=A0AAW0MN90_9GOBI